MKGFRHANDTALVLRQDLSRREYERQMEITKLELLRLSTIRNDLAKIITQFSLALKEYTREVRKLFETNETTKSTMTIG